MNKHDFRNTKIDLSKNTEEERAKFQRLAFENGAKWADEGVKVSYTNKPYFYIYNDNEMTFGVNVNKFDEKDHRQIYYSDLFPDETDPKDLRIKELESQNALLLKEIEELKEKQIPESLIDFVNEMKYMVKLYQNSRYSMGEQTRDKLKEELDNIMRLEKFRTTDF